ncbi:hypothetical protein QX201_004115 [Fusarium graminearum]
MSGKPELGLLGGGQLGRMLCEAASPLEVEIAILDAQDAPAKQVSRSKYHVDGSFKDSAKIRELASHCKVLSVETEHIETAVLEELSKEGKVVVYPSWKTLRLIQDKYEQRIILASRAFPSLSRSLSKLRVMMICGLLSRTFPTSMVCLSCSNRERILTMDVETSRSPMITTSRQP